MKREAVDEDKGRVFVVVNRTTVRVVENDVLSDGESGHYAL